MLTTSRGMACAHVGKHVDHEWPHPWIRDAMGDARPARVNMLANGADPRRGGW